MTAIKLLSFDHLMNPQAAKHPKCKGHWTRDYGDGSDFDCGYNTTITCDECRYGGQNNGRGKDPAAKVNQ